MAFETAWAAPARPVDAPADAPVDVPVDAPVDAPVLVTAEYELAPDGLLAPLAGAGEP